MALAGRSVDDDERLFQGLFRMNECIMNIIQKSEARINDFYAKS